jgi:hypothetical protein
MVLASDNLTCLPTPQLTIREQPFHTKHLPASYISRPYTISLLSTVGKMAEKAVADYLSLIGEERGWWHKGQCGSRVGRSTIDALAYLRGEVNKNRRRGRHTAVLMTDVAAAFPSTSKQRVVKMLVNHKAHPTIIRWVND